MGKLWHNQKGSLTSTNKGKIQLVSNINLKRTIIGFGNITFFKHSLNWKKWFSTKLNPR